MGKFTVKLSRRAFMHSNIVVEADDEAGAREKARAFLNKGEEVHGTDGEAAESVYDLGWTYDNLDENDDTEIVSVSK